MKILFVCTANRFRSASAMTIGKSIGLECDSCGVGTEHTVWNLSTPNSVINALSRMGYRHDLLYRSKKVSEKLMEWADRVLCMGPKQISILRESFPKHAKKVSCLAYYGKLSRINDLAFLSGQDFERTMFIIEDCVKKIIRRFPRSKSTVLNIRGYNGSGKSSIVRGMKEAFEHSFRCEKILDSDGKVESYSLKTTPAVFILGPYEGKSGGGCDRFAWKTGKRKFAYVADRIRKYTHLGNVVLEGAVLSSDYKNWIELQKELKEKVDFIFAPNGVSFKECVKRLNKRRSAAGKKPIDPKDSILKNKKLIEKATKELRAAKLDVRTIPRANPVVTCLHWLKGVAGKGK